LVTAVGKMLVTQDPKDKESALRNDSIYNADTAGTSMSRVRELANHLRAHAAQVARHFLTNEIPSRGKDELRFGSRGSMCVHQDTGRWTDFENHTHGDMLDLVRRHVGDDLQDAVEWARTHTNFKSNGAEHADAWFINGHDRAEPKTNGHAHEEDEPVDGPAIDDVSDLVPTPGTIVQAYHESRLLNGAEDVMYRPRSRSNPDFGAQVCLLRDPAGNIVAQHETLLDANGRKASIPMPKRFVRGSRVAANRAAMRLPGDDKVIVLTEGAEDAVSIWQVTGIETWAVFGVGNFAGAPVNAGDTVIIARDRDAPDKPATKTVIDAVYALKKRGVRVLLAMPPEGFKDANDLLVRGGADAVREYVDSARVYSPMMRAYRKVDTLLQKREYLVKGLFLKNYVYSMTGKKGTGKTAVAVLIMAHISLGWECAGRKVSKSRVLFLAGENPDETEKRLFRTCEVLGLDELPDVVFMPGKSELFADARAREAFLLDAREQGPFGLVVVDSAQEFYPFEDENSRGLQKKYASMIRETLTTLPGNPAVLILAHPVKNPITNHLEPAGGGSFGNATDGNVALIENNDVLTMQVSGGKWRGCREPEPIYFRRKVEKIDGLRDEDGDPFDTVRAEFVGEEDMEKAESAMHAEETRLLKVMFAHPGESLFAYAEMLSKKKDRVRYVMVDRVGSLKAQGLVEVGDSGHYELTKKGKKSAQNRKDPGPDPDVPNGTLHGVDEARAADRETEEKESRRKKTESFT
jgi:AAA domain/Toprim domain